MKRDAVQEPLLLVEGLSAGYGEMPVIMDVALQIYRAEIVALVRALMAAPILIMVDEMSPGLAPIIVEQLMDILTGIRRVGVTVFLEEQDIHLALSIADRGYVMETGRILQSGPARDLIDDPKVRQAYLGA